MEEAVLRDIFPLLKNVDSAYIEVHSNAGLLDRNDCRRIEKILTEANFSIETESRFPLHAFPNHRGIGNNRLRLTNTKSFAGDDHTMSFFTRKQKPGLQAASISVCSPLNSEKSLHQMTVPQNLFRCGFIPYVKGPKFSVLGTRLVKPHLVDDLS